VKVLLHICCGVCASWSVESLRQDGYDVTGFFYNPNIQPEEEYRRRLKTAEKLAKEQGFPLLAGDYDVNAWYSRISGGEKTPEGGKRCVQCFRLRLEKTAQRAQAEGFSAFTTTLTISPHKNAQIINRIGCDAGGGLFLSRDFKKNDGFKKTQAAAKQHNLYQQKYCGCVFSLDEWRRNYERILKQTCPGGNRDKPS